MFVHGLGGSRETWGEFPTLIEKDDAFKGYDVENFTYKTSLWRIQSASSLSSKVVSLLFPQSIASKLLSALSLAAPQSKLPKIQHIANLLKSDIEELYYEYDEIYLITHSMGGLVARKYLHSMIKANNNLQVKKLMLYAVPNNGSKWAKLVALYAHEQVEQLNEESDFLETLNEEMSDINLDEYLEVQYMIGYEDEVVSVSSAKSYHQNKNVKYLPNGHIDIVKPKDREDRPYKFFKNFILGKERQVSKEVVKEYADSVEKSVFVDKVQKILESKKMITLLSQDFMEIDRQQELLIQAMQYLFKENFFHLRVPRVKNNEAKYFELLAKDCGFDDSIQSVDVWHREIVSRLKANRDKKFLFYITDIEDGDEEQNRYFAEVIKSIEDKYTNFYAIFVGRKKLASLVYGKNPMLSPLKDIAYKMFFEEVEERITKQDIRQIFVDLKANGEELCAFLDDEVQIGWDYYSTSVLNTLFWRNIMVNENDCYAWRDEATKELAREIFGCK